MKLGAYYDAIARDGVEAYQHSGTLSNRLLHLPLMRHAYRHVTRELERCTSMADVGCGFGSYLLDHLRRVRRILLVDLSAGMLEGLESRLRSRYPDLEIEVFAGSVIDAPVDAERRYELVTCLGVINHLDEDELERALDRLAALAEERIVLFYAHEGFVLASQVGRSLTRHGVHYRPHSRRRVASQLQARGFTPSVTAYGFFVPWICPMVVQVFEAR